MVVIAIIAIGYVGMIYPKVNPPLGAASGTTYTESVAFIGGATIGSTCFSTTTTGTLTATQLEKNSCLRAAPAGAGQATIAWTLPASTTVSNLLPLAGSCRSWWIDATGLAAATTTTIVAGTGVDLVGLDATGAGTGADVIDGTEQATLVMCRQTDGDVSAFMQEWIHAD